MRDACGNCGATDYSHWRKVYPVKKPVYEVCDKCEKLNRPRTYDDIYKGDCNKGVSECEHLADPDTGQPIPYSTPGEKAAIMKKLGVVQSNRAERVHGARNETIRRTYFS